MAEQKILLKVEHLEQFFKLGKRQLKAVNDVSFEIYKGEVFGLVGESGCGKTTTGRSIIRLYDITGGSVYFDGKRIAAGTRYYKQLIKDAQIKNKQEIKEAKEAMEKAIAEGADEKVETEKYNKLVEESNNRLVDIMEENISQIKRAKYDHKNCNKEFAKYEAQKVMDEYEPLIAKETDPKRLEILKQEYKDKLRIAKNQRIMNKIQMIFQDPIASLDPRMTVKEIIAEGLIINKHEDPEYLIAVGKEIKPIIEEINQEKIALVDLYKQMFDLEDQFQEINEMYMMVKNREDRAFNTKPYRVIKEKRYDKVLKSKEEMITKLDEIDLKIVELMEVIKEHEDKVHDLIKHLDSWKVYAKTSDFADLITYKAKEIQKGIVNGNFTNSGNSIEEAMEHGLDVKRHKYIDDKVNEALTKVGLVSEHESRYPHEFSGGQRQRIGIARAIILKPELIIADEPISALDVSIQAQIINLLGELNEKMGLTTLFIAHDLAVVKYFSHRIAVMYYGKIVELATSDELFAHPFHPYTKSLLSAIPVPDPFYEKQRKRVPYNPISDHDYSVEKPKMREIYPGHYVYCNTEEFERYQKEMETK